MRNTLIVLPAIIVTLFLATSCTGGYLSSDGKMLEQYLAPESLKTLVENPRNDIWIIDVRPESAFKKGHIPTAKSFPSSTILDRLNELPKDIYLIVYCETGGRAQRVIRKLEQNGYTKMMNWGGYRRWKWDFSTTE